MARQFASKHQVALYLQYYNENRCVKNRTNRLKRHIKKFPNDMQAAKALNNGLSYRRDKGHRFKIWKKGGKQLYAQLLRQVGENGNIALEDKSFARLG